MYLIQLMKAFIEKDATHRKVKEFCQWSSLDLNWDFSLGLRLV